MFWQIRPAVAADPSSQPASAPQPVAHDPAETFAKRVGPYLQKYCAECHGEKKQEGKLSFHRIRDFAAAQQESKTWEKAVAKLGAGAMPPEDHQPRPTEAETKEVLAWVDATFVHVDCSRAHDPGRVTIRRLNRSEYDNTIRDLVGIDFQPAKDFPSDDVGYGFDNIGDVLSLPPLLMEKYMDAAEAIADRAIVVGDPSSRTVQMRSGEELKATPAAERDKRGVFHINSEGEVHAEFEFPAPGEYIIRVEAGAEQAGDEPARMQLRIAEKDIELHEIKGHKRPGKYQSRVKVGSDAIVDVGKHPVAARFVNDYYRPDAPDPKQRDRNLLVRSLEVQGPLNPKNAKYPESHTRIIFTKPGRGKSVEHATREIFRRFATRAYRRPVDDSEIDGPVKLVLMAVEQKESFERGVQLGMQAILVSPHFLFRIEADEEPDNPEKSRRLGDYELATRLSYFLWSSMPDDELFEQAAAGKLSQPDVLKRQVQRMLDDPKSQALVKNFGGQWLNLRILDEATPNLKMYPEFDAALRSDMRRETELVFETIMRENRSILDFLDADFTFLNARLAKHYGIAGVEGDEFRKVSLTGPGPQRAGVLTHASILTLTSDPAKTIPVKRGKWILENILGTPPPPPPPNVPPFEAAEKANPKASRQEQLKLHRTNATCALCHEVMDPLGLAFENYDAIGRWRDKEDERPIDASGKLPGGDTFAGPLELVKLLRKREADFSRHLSKAMLTFALGRGLEYYDKCTIDKMTDAVARDGYRFQTLVHEIVASDPFLKRRGDGGRE